MDAKSPNPLQKTPKTGPKPAKNGKKVQIRDCFLALGRSIE